GVGCGQKPIVYVDIRDRTEANGVIARGPLEETLKKEMKRLPGFAFRTAKADETGWQLNAILQQLTDRAADPSDDPKAPKDARRRSVGATLELYTLKGERHRYTGESLLVEIVAPDASLDEMVARAIAKATDDLVLAIDLADAKEG